MAQADVEEVLVPGQRPRHSVVALVLFLFTCIYFFPYLFLSKTLIPYDLLTQFAPWRSLGPVEPQNSLMADVLRQYLPWRTFYRQALLSGEIPFWNPSVFSGMPFLANQQSGVLYPFNLIFLLPSIDIAYTLFIALHVWLAGWGMYLLLERLTVHPIAAFSGALAWMFSGMMAVWMAWISVPVSLAWLPWLLFGVDWLITTGRRRAVGLLAFAVALLFLGGHFQFGYHALLASGGYALWRLASISGWRLRSGRSVAAGSGVLLGLLMAAAQLAPTLELASFGSRSVLPIRALMDGAIPWQHLITLLAPYFYGDAQKYVGAGNFVEFTGYVGLTSLGLAVLGLFHPRLNWRSPFWLFACLALLGLHLAYGGFLHIPLSYLPGYTSFRGIQRFYSFWTIGVAGMAAWGVDGLLASQGKRQKGIRWLAGLFALAAIVGGIGLGSGWPLFSRGVEAVYTLLGIDAPSLARLTDIRASLTWPVGLMGGLGVVIGLVLIARGNRFRSLPSWVAVSAGLLPLLWIGVDLLHFSRVYLPVLDPPPVLPSTPGIDFLRAHPSDGRIVRFGDSLIGEPLLTNMGMAYGLEDIDGYDSFTLDGYNQLVGLVEPERYEMVSYWNFLGNFRRQQSLASPLLDLLGADRLLANGPIADPMGFQEVSNWPVGELVPGYVVEQTFQVTKGGLYRIDLFLATYQRQNTGTLRLELRSELERSSVLAEQKIDVAGLADNAFFVWEFPPLPRTSVGPYRLTLAAETGGPGNAITAWASRQDVYPHGALWLDGKQAEGDLRFRAYTAEPLPGWVLAYDGPDMSIYTNQDALPFAFVPGEVWIETDGERQAAQLAAPEFDPAQQAVLGDFPPLPLDIAAHGTVRVDSRSVNTLDLTVDMHAAPGQFGLVVIRQNRYPGWRARVDGVATDILPVDMQLQAVAVPGGRHSLRLVFQPSYFVLWAALSVVGLVVSLLLFTEHRQSE